MCAIDAKVGFGGTVLSRHVKHRVAKPYGYDYLVSFRMARSFVALGLRRVMGTGLS